MNSWIYPGPRIDRPLGLRLYRPIQVRILEFLKGGGAQPGIFERGGGAELAHVSAESSKP